jgi:S-DNA-T family DNA segregation ATPase FtsK/SpoIIIE
MRLASPDVTHVLITGSKGSGKTELVRTILGSLVLNQKPRDLQLIVADPKGSAYDFLKQTPHLLGDIAATGEQALQQLRWLESELERREDLNVARPRLVVALDGLAELLAEGGREFKVHLTRLAQRGRRAGISLLLCSHKENALDLDVALKTNFPVRLIGKQTGNRQTNGGILAGRGDFILMAGGERVRFQAAYLHPQDSAAFSQALRETAGPGRAPRPNGAISRILRTAFARF